MYLKTILVFFIFYFSNYCFSQNNKNTLLHSDFIDVLHYTIHLNITDISSEIISGNTILRIVPKQNINEINLDLQNLNVDSVKINDELIVNYIYNDTILNILTEQLSVNDTVNVNVFYNGHPQQDPSTWGGFYFQNGYAFNMGVGMQYNPHSYGRIWYPCVDDFIDKATYDFYITTSEENKAVCCGTLMETLNNENGNITYHWNLRDEIPTYLSSVAVAPYISVDGIFNGMNGEIPTYIYVKQQDSMSAVNSFVNLNPTLDTYENCFGPYVWERVGYVAVPFNSGAMEHATNIAYPRAAMNGLSNETLMAHELSHHWFGNLVTCKTPEDMWLNEGWASYCEAIFKEFIYGNYEFKKYVRKNHKEVLRAAHITDNGFRAVSGVPHEYTYSTTVYNKGSTVVHSLRGYLGDSLFFNGVENYINEFSFSSASSDDLKNSMSNFTNVDLTDFFNSWVFQGGYSHFSMDSFHTTNIGNSFEVEVFMRQKLRGKEEFANSNKIELSFFDDLWNTKTEVIEFSGEYGSQTFNLDFEPNTVIVDLNEKICDATTDEYKILKSTNSNLNFYGNYFIANVSEISDSVMLRVEHNWVAPDDFKIEIPNLIISNFRYWEIKGIFNENFISAGKFFFSKKTSGDLAHLDNNWMYNSADSLVLLYRENTNEDWQLIDFTKTGGENTGYLITDNLRKGQYTFAMWDNETYIEKIKNKTSILKIFPNPSKDKFNFEVKKIKEFKISICDTLGKIIFEKDCKNFKNRISWKAEKKGIYIVNIIVEGKKLESKKIIAN